MENKCKVRVFGVLFSMLFPAAVTNSHAQANHVVISQVFGGGGISTTSYNNDFVELFNPTSVSVNLAGWSLQYAIGGSTTYVVTNLTGSIPAKSYFLVQFGRNTTATGIPLPTADLSNTALNIGAVNLKIALVNNTVPFTIANPAAASVDFVGIGTSTGFETAPATAGNTSASLQRKASVSSTAATLANGGSEANAGNAYDTDNNSADFVLQTAPLARNSGVQVLPVRFTGLNASARNNAIVVNWRVAEEFGISNYLVERSSNGTDFSVLATVKASSRGEYSYADAVPAAGRNYYRIAFQDAASSMEYSASIAIDLAASGLGPEIFPNPVRAEHFNLSIKNAARENFQVRMSNLAGQEVLKISIVHEGGNGTYQISTPARLKQGVYIVSIMHKGLQQSLQLVKN